MQMQMQMWAEKRQCSMQMWAAGLSCWNCFSQVLLKLKQTTSWRNYGHNYCKPANKKIKNEKSGKLADLKKIKKDCKPEVKLLWIIEVKLADQWTGGLLGKLTDWVIRYLSSRIGWLSIIELLNGISLNYWISIVNAIMSDNFNREALRASRTGSTQQCAQKWQQPFKVLIK